MGQGQYVDLSEPLPPARSLPINFPELSKVTLPDDIQTFNPEHVSLFLGSWGIRPIQTITMFEKLLTNETYCLGDFSFCGIITWETFLMDCSYSQSQAQATAATLEPCNSTTFGDGHVIQGYTFTKKIHTFSSHLHRSCLSRTRSN